MRCLLLLTCLAFASSAAEPKSIPPDRAADAYSVYSAVLAHPSLSHPDTSAKLLIEDISGALREFNDPQSCIHVPDPYRAVFAELLADRAAHDKDRFRLERAFKTSKPYDLIDESQAAQFRALRSTPGRSTDDVPLFRGATDVLTLSNIYFDRHRTLAAIYTWAWCGSLCAYGTWRVFVNRAGGWEEQNWLSCMTIAD